MAWPDADTVPRAPHLVPGRRAHLQQRAGLRALVPPGAAPPQEVSTGRCPGPEGWAGPRREDGFCRERWEVQLIPASPSPRSGPEVRVLLFNSTGDRDSAALLKLLRVRGWRVAVGHPTSSGGFIPEPRFLNGRRGLVPGFGACLVAR